MPRRRWIDPNFWDDLGIAKLGPWERLFFIGCFSNADDDGRLIGNSAYLRSLIFKYDDMSLEEIKRIRDAVLSQMKNLWLYTNTGEEYLAFNPETWKRYQKPSHYKESKLPPPPPTLFKPESNYKEMEEGLPEEGERTAIGLPMDGDRMERGHPEDGQRMESSRNEDALGRGGVRVGLGLGLGLKVASQPSSQKSEGDKKKLKPHQIEAGLFLDLVEKREGVKLLNRPKLINIARKLFKIADTTPDQLYECFAWLRANDHFLHNKEPPLIISMMPDKYPDWRLGRLKGRVGHPNAREDRRSASDYSGEW